MSESNSNPQAILIRGATILAIGGREFDNPFVGDILIEGKWISAIDANLEAPPEAAVIDGAGKLAMPGLVNAHTPSSETFFRGALRAFATRTLAALRLSVADGAFVAAPARLSPVTAARDVIVEERRDVYVR